MPLPIVHSLYGLRIQTDVPLGVLPLALGDSDVVVRYGPARRLASASPRPGCFEVRPGLACFATLGGTVVVARGGTEIVVEDDPNEDSAAVASLVLGQVFAAILHQRRVLTLHASAVAIDGSAIAFVGDQGAGKTTMASALCQRGDRLVSDDVLAVRGLGDEAPVVSGGYPFLKVTEATAQTFGGGVGGLDAAYASVPKWKRPQPVAEGALPLRALYVLHWGEEAAIRPLAPIPAFAEVARHSFAAGLTEATGTQSLYVEWYSALVRSVPVFDVVRPRSLGRAVALAADVAAHAEAVRGDSTFIASATPARSLSLT
ncbi:hypothetical protein [Rubrivirga sp.]|uniref:hypothetical protein n=1 Tax=Rubrivirga sp. TaxID=1885344 RepID=UPI003B52F256